MAYLIGFLLGVLAGYFSKNGDLILKLNLQRLQLTFSLMQLRMYQAQKRRPRIRLFHKVLFGMVHKHYTTLLDYATFKPHTLIRWHKEMVKIVWRHISKRKNRPGRPPVDDFLRECVYHVANANPSYKHKKIAFILSEQLGIKICASTVKAILKQYHKPKPTELDQAFKTFLANHKDCLVSMDFKVTYDWKAKQMFILNIIEHNTRTVLLSRATYNPDYPWMISSSMKPLPLVMEGKNI